MTAVYPGANNAFVPSHEASGSLTVDFSRNPKDFVVNKWAQIAPAKKTLGYWLNMTVEQAGRLINSALNNFVWPDGTEAPSGNGRSESFEFKAFACKRYSYPFNLGQLTIDQATWDILAQHARIHAQLAMTARTQKLVTLATTTGNWGTHTDTATNLGGGKWDVSTTAGQYIKKSLNAAADLILKDTLGAVNPEDLMVVISPGLARKLSTSQEFVDHVKGSPEAYAQFRGDLPGGKSMFGMPDKLYDYPLVVEKTVKVTSRKGATTARSYVLPDTTPFMCARPGGLVGVEGTPSFSTFTQFMHEEMTVEQFDDRKNRRVEGRVVENFDAILTAPVSGYLFQAVCD